MIKRISGKFLRFEFLGSVHLNGVFVHKWFFVGVGQGAFLLRKSFIKMVIYGEYE